MDANSVSSLTGLSPIELNLITAGVVLLASIIGACIGGYMTKRATIRGVRLAHEMDLNRQDEHEELILKGTYQAIHSELAIVWEGCMARIGDALLDKLEEGKPLTLNLSVRQDYFPIYKSGRGGLLLSLSGR